MSRGRFWIVHLSGSEGRRDGSSLMTRMDFAGKGWYENGAAINGAGHPIGGSREEWVCALRELSHDAWAWCCRKEERRCLTVVQAYTVHRARGICLAPSLRQSQARPKNLRSSKYGRCNCESTPFHRNPSTRDNTQHHATAARHGCPASLQGNGQHAHHPRQGVARASNALGTPGYSSHPEAARRGRIVQEAPCSFSGTISHPAANADDSNLRTPRTSSPWSKARRWPIA